MKPTPNLYTLCLITVAALLLAACTSSTNTTDQASQTPTTIGVTPESEPAATSALANAAATDTNVDTTTTTVTEGLESNAEPAEVDGELTCWRIENFGDDAPDRWTVVNDGVMGGRSEGSSEVGGGVISFMGTINTNGGGFSSIRTTDFGEGDTLAGALEGAEFLRIRTRSSNGRGYEISLTDNESGPSVMHFADIAVTTSGLWQEPLVALADLEARVFGEVRESLPSFNMEAISSFGIILADGLDGPFVLEVDRIDACKTT